MIGILRIFYGAEGTRPGLVLTCLLLAGIFEGIGLASLLPLLSLAINDGAGATSPIIGYVDTALGWVGLEPGLGVLLLLVVGGIVLKCLLTMAAMFYVGYAVAEVATGLRAQLITRLLNVRWGYFTHQPVGRIANAISVDATRSGHAYLMAANFQVNIIQTVVYSLIAALVSWQLALAALALGGTIALSLHVLVRVSKKAGRRQTERTSELVIYLSDALSNIKPLKAMAKAGKFANLFDRKIGQLRRALRRQIVSQYALKNLEEMLVAMAVGVGFFVAISNWNVPVSQLLVMGALLFQTVSSVGKMQRQFQKAVLLESPYWSMRKLIDEAEVAREPNPGSTVPTLEQGCRFQDVSFAHVGDKVLDRVTLDIPARGLTVITGSSGSGKTTLTDLLLGLYQPLEGRILVDGIALSEIDLQAWRDIIGYVPQDLILFHDTILANVTLGDPRIGEEEAKQALQAAGALDFVEAQPEGLQSIVGEKGAKLSGGQRQRIALARALAGKPKLLILDEVTSALDPRTERDICRNIDALSRDMTVLAITHREAWTEIAERTYRLDGGSIELVKDGRDFKRPA
ncbi:ABC transporter ATP-binding protein [Pelagibius litoralis]|uniref:ABC transporter ATP-binding protein n=1 Tax=Pelagibius litoralis TaxID=374515 RepID=A0A967F1W0_9PROT|nr:ABC transporter ATP-binding protein [Pelagibius litoralis]NIA71509.1 ABC transporter ATP-binding protein [Pelagibius litoralis]